MTQIDKNIATNLRRIRKSKNMSLDMLAEQTGVSKSMLGQIERGESNPTVSTISKIVEGLKVPFEQLIYNREEIIVLPTWQQAPVYKEKEGMYRIHILLPYDAGRHFEIYQGTLEKEAFMESISHGEHTWEYLTVLKGKVELTVGEEMYSLAEGASLYFASDRTHSYRNTGQDAAAVSMVLSRENR